MQQKANEFKAVSDECERLRATLSPKVKYMDDLLRAVKESYLSHKILVRNNYPQVKWLDFGIPDTR